MVGATTCVVLLGDFVFFSYLSTYLIAKGFDEREAGLALFAHGIAGVLGLCWAAV